MSRTDHGYRMILVFLGLKSHPILQFRDEEQPKAKDCKDYRDNLQGISIPDKKWKLKGKEGQEGEIQDIQRHQADGERQMQLVDPGVGHEETEDHEATRHQENQKKEDIAEANILIKGDYVEGDVRNDEQ